MTKKQKFNPQMSRITLKSEQAVLTCAAYGFAYYTGGHWETSMIDYEAPSTPRLVWMPDPPVWCGVSKDSPQNTRSPSS
jgi:hypothetical protein